MEVPYEQISDMNGGINPYDDLTTINYETQHLEYYIKEFQLLFEIDKYYECFNLVKKVESMIKEEKIIFANKKKETSDDLLKILLNDTLVSVICEDMKLSEKCLQIYNRIKTVKADKESNGIKTWFSYEEDVKSITICGSTVIKGDLVHIFAVLAEMDLFKEFVSSFDDMILLHSVTSFRLLIHAKMKMPLMVTNRDLILEGFGIVDPVNKCILMPLRGIKTKKYFECEIPEETSQYKRIDLLFGFFHIKCLSKDTYEISNCYNVNPKVPIIPWFILNSVIKMVNYYILDGIRKQMQSEEAKKIYEKRINEKFDFYERIKKEMNTFTNSTSNN